MKLSIYSIQKIGKEYGKSGKFTKKSESVIAEASGNYLGKMDKNDKYRSF